MRLGILTGGGDCPGLNAAIRAVVRHAHEANGATVLGFRDGWRGVLDGTIEELGPDEVSGILQRGGTILGTSGVQPFREPDGPDRVRRALDIHQLDGFVVIGGEGTMGACARDARRARGRHPEDDRQRHRRAPTPASGFQTAVQVATDVDRPALQHRREPSTGSWCVEVMGRSAGWIGLTAGIAGNADVILVPEHPFDIELVAERIVQRHREHRPFSIVVVSEGAAPVPGTMDVPDYPLDPNGWPRLGGIGGLVATEARAADGLREPGDRARPRAARRLAGGVRPCAGHAVRRRGGRRGRRGRVGEARRCRRGAARHDPDRRGRRAARLVPEERWRIPQVLCD